LIQIAEHPQFTAINSLKLGGDIIPVAYKINDEIAVYLKYSSRPTQAYEEYPFNFHDYELDRLAHIVGANPKTFLALVCVEVGEICCISYEHLQDLITRRQNNKGEREDQYVILVTGQKGKSFRVYVNAPGIRKKMLGAAFIVSRRAFPDVIFR